MSTERDVSTLRIAPKVWRDGELIDWDDARVHVMTHAIHYGSSVFEGIRCYATKKGPAVFRLTEHMQRLLNSAKIYRMETKITRDELCRAAVELVRHSQFPNPVQCYIASWDWGKYLGEEAVEAGVDVCVSSWTRITSNSMPAMAKAGANYMNSQLIKMEAILGGFAEGIALDDRGYVSEGSGENIFLVNNGTLITPPLGASILPGITRDSVIQIAREMGIAVQETSIQRAALYLADEVFFTGTAAEITPIRSVDRITVGTGKRGEVTKRLQDVFFDVIVGEKPAPNNASWLTYVNEASATANVSE
jgi:branched-chain amino acid aminotransferase